MTDYATAHEIHGPHVEAPAICPACTALAKEATTPKRGDGAVALGLLDKLLRAGAELSYEHDSLTVRATIGLDPDEFGLAEFIGVRR